MIFFKSYILIVESFPLPSAVMQQAIAAQATVRREEKRKERALERHPYFSPLSSPIPSHLCIAGGGGGPGV